MQTTGKAFREDRVKNEGDSGRGAERQKKEEDWTKGREKCLLNDNKRFLSLRFS